jgi:hypothetical protein
MKAVGADGKALQQQSTDPVDVQGCKHEIPIDGNHQGLGAKVEIWDQTRGSNDGVNRPGFVGGSRS